MPKYTLSKKKKNKQDLNEAGRRLKKKRKHKGMPSGHRHSLILSQKKKNQSNIDRDPRIGSKKQIALIRDTVTVATSTEEKVCHSSQIALEQELRQLENDPKIEQLLDRLELNERLNTKDQDYLDTILKRIDTLMTKLGYEYDIDDNQGNDDIMKLLKQP